MDTSVRSTVTINEMGEFTGVTGEYRVKNVLIGSQPLDVNKTYTVASINYLLRDGGDGFILSGKCEIIDDRLAVDIDVVQDYIKNTFGGVIPEKYRNPEGEGRIRITDGTSQPDVPEKTDPESSGSESSENSKSEPAKDGADNTGTESSASGSTQVPQTGAQTTAAQAAFATVVISAMAVAVFARKKK